MDPGNRDIPSKAERFRLTMDVGTFSTSMPAESCPVPDERTIYKISYGNHRISVHR